MKLGRLFEESQARMRIDHVLDQRDEIFGHQVRPRRDAVDGVEVAVRLALVIGHCSARIGHRQQVHEPGRFVVKVTEDPGGDILSYKWSEDVGDLTYFFQNSMKLSRVT